mmetsp:Transcript_18077/g.50214  ORF Transcript_18077/g.50214 Transcript_18077/m.50214 type:complete len:363 (-) Transcript_18077:253-1341(-)
MVGFGFGFDFGFGFCFGFGFLSGEGIRDKKVVGVLPGQRLDGLDSQNIRGGVVDKEQMDPGPAVPVLVVVVVVILQQDPGNLQQRGNPRAAGHQSHLLPSAPQDRRAPVHHPLLLERGRYRVSLGHVAQVGPDAAALPVGIGLDDQVEVAGLVGMGHGAVRFGEEDGLVVNVVVNVAGVGAAKIIDLDARGKGGIRSQDGPALRESVPQQTGVLGEPGFAQEFVGLLDHGRYRLGHCGACACHDVGVDFGVGGDSASVVGVVVVGSVASGEANRGEEAQQSQQQRQEDGSGEYSGEFLCDWCDASVACGGVTGWNHHHGRRRTTTTTTAPKGLLGLLRVGAWGWMNRWIDGSIAGSVGESVG